MRIVAHITRRWRRRNLLAEALSREPYRFIYPRWTWWPAVQAIRVLFQEAVMRPLVWLLAAPAVARESEHRLPEQPLLLIANHVTAFDAPLVLYALPAPMRRKVAIAMAGEMLVDWRHARHQGNWLLNLLAPFEYWLVTALFNVFPLPRSAGFRRSFAHAGEAMDHGYHVLVFPEGRCPRTAPCSPFAPALDCSHANRRPGFYRLRCRVWANSSNEAALVPLPHSPDPRRQKHRTRHATRTRGVRGVPSPCPRRSAAR